MSDRQTRIEQALAFGRSDQWITAKIGATVAEIKRVRAHLEEVAYQHDDADEHVRSCPQGHRLTLDNLAHRKDGRRECLTCKRNRAREFGRAYRARKKAA